MGREPTRAPAHCQSRTVSRVAAQPPHAQRPERRLEEELVAHHPKANTQAVREAWQFAVEAHGTQKRASGEPYVSHPLAVARILADFGLDPETIQAALLHDIPEDTDYSIERHRGALRRRRRRSSSTASPSCPSSARANARGAAGREHPQDAAGDGGGHPRRAHQARRPAAQHAHHRGAAAREAGAHRPPDGRDLRAAGRASRDLADQVGARGPVVQGARAGEYQQPGRAAREPAPRARDVRQARHGRAARRAGEGRASRPSCRGRPEAHQQHLEKDAAQGRQLRRDLRRARDPRAGERGPATVTPPSASFIRCGGRFRASSTTTSRCPSPTATSRLHTAVIAIDGKPLEVQIRTHAMHRVSRDGHRRALALQGRRQGPTSDYDAKLSPGCAS